MAPRWRKKSYRKRGGGVSFQNGASSSGSSSETADSASMWLHWTTRRDLLRYLVHFREECITYHHQRHDDELTHSTADQLDSEPIRKEMNLSSFSVWSVLRSTLWGGSTSDSDRVQRPSCFSDFLIGGIIFPPLTAATCRQRYVTLPNLLSSRQRRLVHACCVEADLFHESFDETNDDSGGGHGNRVVVISCYADGFDTIPQLQQSRQKWLSQETIASDDDTMAQVSGSTMPMHHYKPWFCRAQSHAPVLSDNENQLQPLNPDDSTPTKSNTGSTGTNFASRDKVRAEALAVTDIFKLIDQPGRCLREERDALSYEKWIAATLADIEPPITSSTTVQGDGSWTLVNTAEKMKQCIEELEAAKPSELAFDVEAYNVSKYTQLTCLLQVATNYGREYVIDTLAPGVWDEVPGLARIFADPSIVKVGHSIGGLDVKALHRDFGCFIVNAFDTYEASKILRLESQGLAAVCAHYDLRESDVYTILKETYQKCDWRVRPLTEPMIRYARYDVHYLLRLRWLMMRDMVIQYDGWGEVVQEEVQRIDLDLVDMDATTNTPGKSRDNVFDFYSADLNTRTDYDDDATFKTPRQRAKSDEDMFHTPSSSIRNMSVLDDDDNLDPTMTGVDMTAAKLRLQPLLMSCLSISQERCRDLWSAKAEPHLTNDLFVSLVKRTKRGEVQWSSSNTDLYTSLIHWRQQTATDLECLPGFVVSLDFLVAVAWKRPSTESGLRRISYELPALLEERSEYCSQLLDLVLQTTLQSGLSIPTGTIFRYNRMHSNPGDFEMLLEPAESMRKGQQSSDSSADDLVLKLLVAGSIGFGFIVALLDARKQWR